MTDRRYRAILIGNSRFSKDSTLAQLEGPANDVPLMYSMLTHAAAGLFRPEDVRRLPERPIHELRLEIERFFAEAKSSDVLVFYYSGHGLRSTSNQLYLCANDTETAFLNSTAIGSTWLNDTMANSASSTIVVVLDCCHSGAFKGGGEAPLPAGRFVLMSSRPSELATDTVDPNRPSLFTQHLAEGLSGAAAEHHEITIDDVYQYAYDKIVGYGKQHPQFHGKGQGRLIIARGAAAPVPVATPLALSATEIRFPEPFPAGRKPPIKRVFVQSGSGSWAADSPTDWVTVTVAERHFDVSLDPPPGDHVAFVYIHDQVGGAVIEVPIEVTVHAPPVQRASGTHPVVYKSAHAERQVAPVEPTAVSAEEANRPPTEAEMAEIRAQILQVGVGLRSVLASGAAHAQPKATLSVDAIKPLITGWIRSVNVPGMTFGSTVSTILLRARKNSGVATSEPTIAFLHVGAFQAVVFTDVGVYWSDAFATSACRYVTFPGKIFESTTDTHVTFGDGVPRPVGAQHAKPLAQLLNTIREHVRQG